MNVKLVMTMVSLGIYGLYYFMKFAVPPIARKARERRVKKEEKLRRMDIEAIDVEWRFV